MEIENMAGKNIQLIESDMEDPSLSIEGAGHEVNIPMVEYHNAINDLYNWEWKNRMEEQNNQPNEEDGPILIESVPPLSQNCEKISNIIPEQQDNNIESIHELKEKAVKLKEEGNVKVKLGEYGSAIKYYTEAIDIYKNDPTFYANRAQCHLKLENYEECIKDCKEAIELDPKYGKAYYRLMSAYENLGDIENAFRNCRIILELEPKNQQAITSYERIKDKLKLHECEQISINDNDTKLSHIFKSLPKDVEEIEVIDNKPPHLRSKTPLKRVHIVEINDEPEPLPEEMEKISLVNKIDKAIKEVKNETLTKGSDQSSGSVSQNYSDIDRMLAIDLTLPRNVPEFYSTWKSLTNFQKYLYLKIIEPSDINKFLGHGFNYDTLIEILTTLKDYHITNGEKIGKLFFNISNHDEVKIIGYFLTRNDQQIISELLDYMQKQNDEVDCIEQIKIKFNLIKN